MKNVKLLSIFTVLSALFVSIDAKADMVTDAHGNVGYDSAAECDAAVAAGTAKFYESFTHKAPLKRKGEAKVQRATLRELGEQYARGACDVGMGRRMGREGVSTILQGKYIPYSPDMPVNVYTDAAGNATRITMAQCDNWFSGSAPRPVAVLANHSESTTVAQPSEPNTTMPVETAPVMAAAAGVKPYVFGTLGALDAGTKAYTEQPFDGIKVMGTSDDRDTRAAGQIGFGVQFNEYLGAEAFYTGSDKHKFEFNADTSELNQAGYNVPNQKYTAKTQQHTYGARLTVGKNLTDRLRLFGKAGVAGSTVKIKSVTGGDATAEQLAASNGMNLNSMIKEFTQGKHGTFARATAGLGATYHVTDKLAVRADYDHYFKKKYKNQTDKGKNYLGVGVQYNFR